VRACILIAETFARMKASKEDDKVKDNDLFAQDKIAMMVSHFDALTISIFRKQLASHPPKDA
jgi:hypothetical protein